MRKLGKRKAIDSAHDREVTRRWSAKGRPCPHTDISVPAQGKAGQARAVCADILDNALIYTAEDRLALPRVGSRNSSARITPIWSWRRAVARTHWPQLWPDRQFQPKATWADEVRSFTIASCQKLGSGKSATSKRPTWHPRAWAGGPIGLTVLPVAGSGFAMTAFEGL